MHEGFIKFSVMSINVHTTFLRNFAYMVMDMKRLLEKRYFTYPDEVEQMLREKRLRIEDVLFEELNDGIFQEIVTDGREKFLLVEDYLRGVVKLYRL